MRIARGRSSSINSGSQLSFKRERPSIIEGLSRLVLFVYLRGFMSVHHRAAAALSLMLLSVVATAQVPVQVETVSNRAIVRQINVTGTVTSPRTAVLSTAVAGLVSELTIDEGHHVKTGEALLKLDAELAQLALERALAEVRQHETAVADARRRFTEAEEVGTERGIART